MGFNRWPLSAHNTGGSYIEIFEHIICQLFVSSILLNGPLIIVQLHKNWIEQMY